jgi:hypothetical protein
MATDAPNGLLNQWVVAPGKQRKAAAVKSDDIAPAEKPADDKPTAAAPAKSVKAK